MFGASFFKRDKKDRKRGAPHSDEFDDVYFSVDDGLAETQYVFLDGNGLPDAWAGREQFTICETGFGTGLNFLAAWKLFEDTARDDQRLHFISFEKYPMDEGEIEYHLQPWKEVFPKQLAMLCAQYPVLVPGFHRMSFCGGQVTLSLIFGDVNVEMARVNARVDAWFLDGFKPSTNPDMWSETVFQQMARLSADDARFATFTAAGAVKRGLRDAGFAVEKVKGFGRKRDMLVGRYVGDMGEGGS